MKRDEQDRLLNEIIAGEEMSEFRQTSLAGALDAIQRQKRRRRVFRGALAIAPVLLALAVFFGRRTDSPMNLAVHHPGEAQNDAIPPTQTTAPIKVINDEELFALFPDRSLALLGPPGQQQLVFLDQARKKEIPPRL